MARNWPDRNFDWILLPQIIVLNFVASHVRDRLLVVRALSRHGKPCGRQLPLHAIGPVLFGLHPDHRPIAPQILGGG